MLPMSLYETGESNGSVSLSQIMDDESYDIDGVMSDLRLEILFIAACRGGWSRYLALSLEEAKLEIAKDYFRQIYQKDIIAIDGVRRNQELARTLIWSYERNMATTAKKSSIFANVKATQNTTENGVKVIPVGCLKD